MAETKIHLYDKKEEAWNTYTHLSAGILAFIGMVFMMLKVGANADILIFLGILVYCFSNVCVYTVSALYHGAKQINRKILWQKADHSMVGLIIAGSATPLLIVVCNSITAAIFLCVIWFVTIFNIGLNIVSVSKFKKQSQLMYLLAIVLVAVGMLIERPKVDYRFYILLLTGVAVLGIGWIFYFQKSRKYTHVVWHFADMICSALHFIAFYLYII